MTITEELNSMDITHYEMDEAELYIRTERMDDIRTLAIGILTIVDDPIVCDKLQAIIELTV